LKTEQLIYTIADAWEIKSNNNLGAIAQLVLLFGNRNLLKEQKHFDSVRTLYPNAEIVGCSTSGEIFRDELFNNSIICTAIYFENTIIKVVSEQINSMHESFTAGKKLVQKLEQEALKHVLIFSEGLTINGSELINGINTGLNNSISVTGGLAGDQADFNETLIIYNQPGVKNIVLAIGFYGEHIQVGYGSLGGWDAFGVDRLVTKSKANVLYELDGLPALELYKKYLGHHAADLPASALLFPLSFNQKDSFIPVVRTVLSIDETAGSLTFAGDIPEGGMVRLMKASLKMLVQGAHNAAEMAKISLNNNTPDLALLISCVGRKLVMKQNVEEELECVREVLGENTVMTGFYSYGEISPVKPFEQHCELHNQTMTITVFKEN